MFELNPKYELKEEIFMGSKIYTIDNFYKNPEEVEHYLFKNPPPLWKMNESPSLNGVHFEDRRLTKSDDRLRSIVDFLSGIVSQKPEDYHHNVTTNQARFFKDGDNDFENCHWWPHYDPGYNGIIYFNEDCECGTNFYEELNHAEMICEHHKPWRPKEDFKVLKHLQPKYNRLVFFDGAKFLHGMNIANDRYFGEEYRKNQVFFFTRLKKLERLEKRRQTVRKVAQ